MNTALGGDWGGSEVVPEDPEEPRGVVPGKLNLLSRWPGEGLGGVVALEGLDEVRKGAGDDGVEDVVEDGLLLESRFMAGGCSCRTRDARMGQGCRLNSAAASLLGTSFSAPLLPPPWAEVNPGDPWGPLCSPNTFWD